MKKLILLLFWSVSTMAQVSYTSPQSVVATPISNAAAAQTSSCITNVGQTVHLLTYTVNTANLIQIRLEGSYDSDSATCTSGTWFAISDDATESSSGEVLGIGYYPFIRVNLVTCSGCTGVTARYSGISSSPSSPFGFYNPSQQIRKMAIVRQPANAAAASGRIAAPYGSTAGELILVTLGGNFPAGSTVSVTANMADVNGTPVVQAFPLSTTTTIQAIPMPVTPTTSVGVSYLSGGASAANFDAYYIFYPPGESLPATAQPARTENSEATAVGAAVTTTITAGTLTRGHLYNVSARCSAGTAQLTVQDGATTIWSSAPTEVGTTTFKNPWNPALPASPGNNLVITLSTCGAGNTGTLDVQGSLF